MPALAGSLGTKRRFEHDPKFSGFDRSRANRLLQVTPVNLVPEAVTTHGIRGSETRARSDSQIIRTTGVSCSSCPPLPSVSMPPLPFPVSIFILPLLRCIPPFRLPVGHARCIYVDPVAQPRVRIAPTIPDNLAQSLRILCVDYVYR